MGVQSYLILAYKNSFNMMVGKLSNDYKWNDPTKELLTLCIP